MTSNQKYYVSCHICGGRGTKAFDLETAREVARNHRESGHKSTVVVNESGRLAFQ